MISERTTTIGRLRVRADVATAAGAEQRAGSALRPLDLVPPAMPPQAILCIRALTDPMPRSLDLRSSVGRPAREWEEAVRRSTADHFRRAVRPVRGPVRDDAEAVLFADRAELLACAARDAVRGLLSVHWWWLHLLLARSLEGVVREWRSEPAYIPAAMELLAATRDAVGVARHLDPPSALQLALVTLQAHGHEALVRELLRTETAAVSAPTVAPSGRELLPPIVAGEAKHAQDAAATAAPVPPVLAAFLPEAAAMAEATIEQRLFLVVTLTLRRAPSMLRRSDAVVALARWFRAGGHPSALATLAAEVPPGERRANEPPSPVTATPPMQSVALPTPGAPEPGQAPVASPSIRREQRNEPEAAVTEPDSLSDRPSMGLGGEEAETHAEAAVVQQPARREEAADVAIPSPSILPSVSFHSPARAAATEARPLALTDAALHSQVAGAFFLLNAAIALGYYSDFTARDQEGCPLDPWQFLALVGRTLLESQAELPDEVAADPIWPLLGALAGDDTAAAEPSQLEELTRRIGQYVASALAAWRSDEEDRATSEIATLLLRPGRIVLTPAHLDVHFNLADHPIAIRLSGLDRNPGWIPAAGRHVAFHFD